SDGLQSSGMYPKGYKTAMPRRCESGLAARSRERASSDLPCGFIDFSDPIWYKTCTEQLENLQQENAPLIASSAAASTAGHALHRSFLPLPSVASLPPDRRGRLRNGARPGDFLAAPRCGARTRCGGSCRQPAMANGRCRMHGGLSTGPRTPEGRARCARARLTHGAYSAATRALNAEARAWTRRIRSLVGLMRHRRTAGHGVLPTILTSGIPGGAAAKAHHRVHRDHRGVKGAAARAARNHPASVSSVNSVVKPSTAGHGVLPPNSRSRLSPRALHLLSGTAPL